MMTGAMLRLEDVALGYGEKLVLEGIDLEVSPGEFIGILGPNGSGKSTLLYGMLGLIPPRAGTLTRGIQQVAYVPQRENLDRVFPLTVGEVVAMGAYGRLRLGRGLGAGDRELVRKSLDRVGLADRNGDLFSSLSGGQRQRVLIARALVTRSALLLLDEPTAGIDVGARHAVLHLLGELNQQEGVTILMVTHDADSLRGLADSVLWVGDRRVKRVPLVELPVLVTDLESRRASARI